MPEESKKEHEEKKEDENIILHVDMHCEGCKAKVKKAISGITGVEVLEINLKDQKVIVKGKQLDAKCVYEAIKKKSGRHTILIHPDLTKLKDEKKQEAEPKKEEGSPPLPPPDPEVTIVLKVNMHCGACAKKIKRSLLKMDGVTNVNEDVTNSTMIIKGKKIDANKVCDQMRKKSRKHCEIVSPPPPKEENKEDKPTDQEKKEDSKAGSEANSGKAEGKEEKNETQVEEKKEQNKYEENKDEKKEEKKDEVEELKLDIKKHDFTHCPGVPRYVYPPQLFSDENPNACSIM